MVDNVENIQITIQAVDQATPVIEDVHTARADLATGRSLGSLLE